ncbi:MAG: 16S rRNA (uracil(1498)-N(3))-methyltransferase [Actinobacteria bacterium]|nr:16S rRNA (uracil(1498)-N(3))-methyltransferase [Actinomycetota bacterium]
MSHPYFFISEENVNEDKIEILNDDLKHLGQVLRAKTGDRVELSDNKKFRYQAEIIEINKNKAVLKILNKKEIYESPIKVFLFQCLLKRSSMELVIQKAAETGINTIIPVASKRSVITEKTDAKKISRWQKIADEASKQAKRDFKCRVLQEVNLTDIKTGDFNIFYLPYEEASSENAEENNIIDSLKNLIADYKKSQNIVNSRYNFAKRKNRKILDTCKVNKDNCDLKIGFIIGPEGGFDEKEIDFLLKQGALPISLGRNILKAETAAVYVSSVIRYILEIYY